ncbi:hypothetical protein N7509_007927 [Penicillium cosmopolitanum]|uniref:Uncharacterized protein n=1 Tax=Penicillium cosmopolitanum TaxID=1131564 RepID=A0A9X0B8U6_9EURO|nr:uncharacterized protein N7509_007927 [Penicillium cosmopolitanum]KAJ5392437.1 hypothetical protein N7509_007927 [Penicillium cosmopolitanum]
MKRDASGGGFTHLGKDGVLRTISGNYEVLDARGLSPEQINGFLDVMPAELARREDFRDVDGTKVTTQEGLFNPAPGILPSKPGDNEQEDRARREAVEDNQAAYEQSKRNQ